MWDKPHLLRTFTIVLLASSVVMVAYGVMHYVLQLPAFRLRTVQLASVPVHVDVNQVNRLIKQAVGGSFFTVDLVKTRKAFEQLPWVRKVGVRRQFPWGLEIALEEHKPLARWNDTQLVNTYGEVFDGQVTDTLPQFYGEPDTSAQVAELYVSCSDELAKVKLAIEKIRLTARFSWELQLENGMTLELGREQVKQRLARFVVVYPYSIAQLEGRVNRVDMRYRNGFAVSDVAGSNTGRNRKSVSRG